MKQRFFLLGWLVLFLLSGCQTLKHLPEGELLFRGADIRLTGAVASETRSQLQEALEEVVYPQPNTRLFGQYVGLHIHQRSQKQKGARLAKRLNKRFGEAPVFYSAVDAKKLEELMQNRLENRGYFDFDIRTEAVKSEKTGRLQFDIQVQAPYRLAKYEWFGEQDTLSALLRPYLGSGSLRPGSLYNLADFRSERERLDRVLKDRGFYGFAPDYFIFRADTNLGNRSFNLFLSIKKDTPDEARVPYQLSEIRVHPNHAVTAEGAQSAANDTVVYNRLRYIEAEETFLPKYLSRYILLQPGQPYNRSRELLTTNRLSSVGNFQYVTLRFTLPDSLPAGGTATQPLGVDIYLSPKLRRQLSYETQFLSKSNNFVGPALKVGYQNRNLFKGGEILNIATNVGFETQFAGGRQTGLNSYELGLKGELIFPRVLSPVTLGDNVSYGIAKTRVVASVNLLNRLQFYRLRSTNLGFGYSWNTNRFVSHDWQPLSLSFTGLSRTSAAFEDILAGNPFLRQSFDQRFIAGMVYQFTFSELNEDKKHRWVALASLDASGNLFGALLPNNELLGEAFAQYVRFDADLRHHWQLRKERRLVFRAFAGAGLSYGNSQTLPYIKQYFSGGPNSVRAFNIRSLGPGAYRPLNFDAASFFDQAGDIKLEANVEYRFPMFPYVKGAWFADAGNIWLLRPNPALGGGNFTANWAQELGVGAGFGLRIDVDILVIRFDLATPLRKPWLPAGNRWLEDVSPGQRAWRRENLNLVFAIGYPF